MTDRHYELHAHTLADAGAALSHLLERVLSVDLLIRLPDRRRPAPEVIRAALDALRDDIESTRAAWQAAEGSFRAAHEILQDAADRAAREAARIERGARSNGFHPN